MSEITGKVNGGKKTRSTEDLPTDRHDEIHGNKQAGEVENNGNKERAKNPDLSSTQGIAMKKNGTKKENDGIGTPTSAHRNGRPAGIAENKGGCAEVKGNRTASAINQDPLQDSGSKINGSKDDGKKPRLELQGTAVGEPSEKKRQGGEEGKVSGTEGKQEGNRVHDLRGRGGKEGELKGTSEERVRRTRLARLKHSDYAEYWKRGGREKTRIRE